MKRDMDLVRDFLLYVEDNHDGDDLLSIDYNAFEGTEPKIVYGHLEILTSAGYLKPQRQSFVNMPITLGLTWEGHEFLDSIRDPEIWAQTKDAANAVGGWTLSILSDLATGFIKTKIKKHTGVEI